MSMQRFSTWCLLLVSLAFPALAQGDVKLPHVFGEHMVLQRQRPIKIWGTASPAAQVHVTFDGEKVSATAGADGKWQVSLKAHEAGGPFELTIAEGDQPPAIHFKDILVGEVWICSGQSNMQWTVRQSDNPDQEIAAANHPQIRHLGVARQQAALPQDDFQATWAVCSPETAGDFTAVGYYFGRTLHQELKIPIGLINSSWGGTRVEPWTPPVGFAGVEALAEIDLAVRQQMPGTPEHRQLLTAHLEATEAWLTSARQALADSSLPSPSPAYPPQLTVPDSHQSPTKLYNAMIHPLVGLPLRGAIWYQGESNHTEGMLYFDKKRALIEGWRKLWKQDDFPFYFVQIAPFQYGNEDPEILARFWEAQNQVTEIPQTGMVVISDIGNLQDIHPKNKQDVGRRLAELALKNDYGKQDVVAGPPRFEKLEIQDGSLRVHFSNTGKGLKTRDGKAPDHFEVVGADGKFYPAEATIDGDAVVLTSPEVKQPVALRFAWHKLAEPNLVNSAGHPAPAFRAGEVPSPVSAVPGLSDYQLVYELDFSRLGADFAYQVDQSAQVGTFDRVAYCLELTRGSDDLDFVFVSMPAFTKDVKKIGVPTFASGIRFQMPVGPLDVYTNVEDLQAGTGLQGNLEFWPDNYSAVNGGNVPGASNQVYDIGDSPNEPANGYGCMQVHHTTARQTLFAVNRWSSPDQTDLGIGNSSGETRDWTFARNIGEYSSKRLRIFVRPL